MMINTKKVLHRRSFLKGAGASIAVPFLSAMVPALGGSAARAATTRPLRAGFVYVPNGLVMSEGCNWWTPTTVGSGFEFTRTLKPLEHRRQNVTVVSNLMGVEKAGQHTGACSAWLTDAEPRRTTGADVRAGVSIDQVIARNIQGDTVFPSMQLAIEDASHLAGTCEDGFSCAYFNTISWATPTQPAPMQVNPRVVFERLFGGTGTPEQRLVRMQTNRSILDSVLEETRRLASDVDASDRIRMESYLENIREVEQRIQRAEARNHELANIAPDSPIGVPPTFREHVEMMFDLLHISYQADISRVFGFMMARELSSIAYPEIGVREPHHGVSHHGDKPDEREKKGKIDEYHMQLFANFVDKLAATPDGDGTLFDNTLLMYGAGMSNGDRHSKIRLPVALVSGFVRGDRHIEVPDKTRTIGDLHIAIARQFGIEMDSFGRAQSTTIDLS
ncbi:MAG: DUF1552 domain-containing protein [Gammaproteobacteria bacterium]|nr:DUF1552 domain-containing protein [Gammaproteobacteria bacterium]